MGLATRAGSSVFDLCDRSSGDEIFPYRTWPGRFLGASLEGIGHRAASSSQKQRKDHAGEARYEERASHWQGRAVIECVHRVAAERAE